MCSHRLSDNPTGPLCDNPDPHKGDGKGCTHTASAGPDLDTPHRHADQEDCA
jgi:hypothetical protein